MENLPVTHVIKQVKELSAYIKEAEVILGSNIVKEKDPASIALVLRAADELNLPYAFALGNLHPIPTGGKTVLTADYKLKLALASRGGVKTVIDEYFEQVNWFRNTAGFDFPLTRKEMEEQVYGENPKYHLMIPVKGGGFETIPEEREKLIKIIKIAPPFINDGVTDRRTTVTMTKWRKVGGSVLETTHTASYYLHQAYQNGKLGDDKPALTWLTTPNRMLMSKAVHLAFDIVCPELGYGMPSYEDMAEIVGQEYTFDEEGNIVSNDTISYEDATLDEE